MGRHPARQGHGLARCRCGRQDQDWLGRIARQLSWPELIAERLTGVAAETYTNGAMQWGIEKEPDARAAYEWLKQTPRSKKSALCSIQPSP